MSDNIIWWRRNWKLVVNLITLAAMIILIYVIRHQLGQTLHNLRHINVWVLLLMIPIEALNYHGQSKLYVRLFATVGNRLSYRTLFRVALELNMVNHIFPSGGVTGLSYFNLRLRRYDIRTGKASLVQVMKLALTFLSFEVLLLIGMFVLAVAGRASNLTIFIGTAVTTLLLVGTLAFSYIIGSQIRINHLLTTITRGLNKLIHVVLPRSPETINIEKARTVFIELHDSYQQFRNRKAELKMPFWYALLMNATEIAAIYIVYVAFGHWVNVGAVVLAYAIANFAGLVSVLPGGVGVYEALMVGIMASAGVPAALTLPVIVMYRVVNTLVQVPLGYYLYHKALGETNAS